MKEIINVHGESCVLDKLVELLDSGWDDDVELSVGDMKKEMLNTLWCM